MLTPYLDREIRSVGIDGKLMVGRAERLEMEDVSVDAIVSTLVLCSVDDPVKSLAEIRRILKPGGRLVFIEHVVAADGTLLRAVQRSLNPLWKRLVDGCHLTRDTERTILKTGFSEVEVERFSAHAGPVAPHIAGWARK